MCVQRLEAGGEGGEVRVRVLLCIRLGYVRAEAVDIHVKRELNGREDCGPFVTF